MGTVKSWNDTRGFGWIISDKGLSLWVHYDCILMEGRKTLRVGQRVTYDVYEHDLGPIAKNVRIVE